MTRGRRSPNYPQISLRDAIGRVNKIYKAENSHRANKEVIAKVLGYSSLNGTSLTMIGALNRYGLLEADGDGLKVSCDAVDILVLPEGEPVRVEALQKCAFEPRVFADLHTNFGENLPSDANLRHYLVTKQDFLEKAADEVIRIYRENVEFLTTEASEYTSNDLTNEQQQPSETSMGIQRPRMNNPNSAFSSEPASSSLPGRHSHERADLKLRIGEDAYAILKFEGVVTQEAIAKLIALLQLQQDLFPTKEMLARAKEQAKEQASDF
jgi:hypothetical protein